MPRRGREADGDEEQQPHKAFVAALFRNSLRWDIMALLVQRPGMNKHQIAKELGVHVNNVRFHVDRLERAKLVETRPGWTGRETLCFTADNVELWDNPSTRVLFGRGPPREVAMYLAEHPGSGVQDVADALDLSPHTVRRHIRTLAECDLVQRMRVDQQVIYHAEPDLLKWHEQLGQERKWEYIPPNVER